MGNKNFQTLLKNSFFPGVLSVLVVVVVVEVVIFVVVNVTPTKWLKSRLRQGCHQTADTGSGQNERRE